MAIVRLLPRPDSKEQFLVAGRALGVWESAFSIAATWIWAPALFLAAQKAYTQGLAGVFWFTVPNVACLILFAPFARKIREMVPEGYTLSAYMGHRFSRRVQGLYLVEMAGLAACSFAVQLLAGGKVLSHLTGLNFFWLTVVLAAIALSYSLLGGLKSSVVTDYLQMVIILIVGGVSLVWVLLKSGGMETVMAGLGGASGRYGSLFSGDGLSVAYGFGIAVTVGLLAGPFGDQSFWQRAFATRRERVAGAFVRGAFIFGIVPVMMAVLGFVAAGRGWPVQDPALVNVEVIARLLPEWMMIPFVLMLLSGLISTLDSNLCAISSIMGHDPFAGRPAEAASPRSTLRAARGGMLLLAAAGVLVANIPGMKILYLFLFYGTLRASTLLPTVIALLKQRISEPGLFWGISASIAMGLPIFAYGNFTGRTGWAVAGSLFTVLTSGAIALVASGRGRAGRSEARPGLDG
ncbi:MAG: hypothetical protein KKB20_01615 [Proteobacteria bacterium]|nr:hypothetical protein [Pseudomonadota bacterium]